jgi:hypothetical protein
MSKLPTTINLINKYHEDKQEKPRAHLGCSLIGHKCERYLWLNFRWAVVPKHEGRLLRLFRRGHLEETSVIRDLRAIGVDVRGTQTRVDFGKHLSGSLDGVIIDGLPESPKKHHVLEIKTHSKKSFEDLVAKCVEKSKPLHYAQMQVYMLGTNLERAFYYAICKDNDEIYTERIKLDKEFAEKLVAKGHRIAMQEGLPPPISTDPSWYECKICDAHDFCHGSKMTKQANCRTCAHSTPTEDSKWRCERWDAEIPLDAQQEGCDSHVFHPDLVPYKFKPAHDEWHGIYFINDKEVLNGEQGFKSTEIIANPNECANPCEFTKELRETMGGRLI